jgi:hypothetical protein
MPEAVNRLMALAVHMLLGIVDEEESLGIDLNAGRRQHIVKFAERRRRRDLRLGNLGTAVGLDEDNLLCHFFSLLDRNGPQGESDATAKKVEVQSASRRT